MSTELQTLQTEIDGLLHKKYQLEAENFKNNLIPLLNDSIGKTFVYRNNHHGDNKYWDTFRRLLSVVFGKWHAWALFEECEITSEGYASLTIRSQLIQRDGEFPDPRLGWVSCTNNEYDNARERTIQEIENPTTVLSYLYGI